jgi:ATP-dependent Clp protease ATP-binding subunit ClpC
MKKPVPTEKFEKVVDLARKEAIEQGSEFVSVDHLLIALLRNGTGRAHDILSESGLTLERVRRRLMADEGGQG